MSKEYIERRALFEKLHDVGSCDAEPNTWAAGYDAGIDLAIDILEKEPAADVVEVVRCKECKHYDTLGCKICILHSVMPDEYESGTNFYTEADDYCSYGERKDDAK